MTKAEKIMHDTLIKLFCMRSDNLGWQRVVREALKNVEDLLNIDSIVVDEELFHHAEEAYKSYNFEYEICDPTYWKLRKRDDCRVVFRTISLKFEGRIYHRVFAVVFKQDSFEIENISFGDLLP